MSATNFMVPTLFCESIKGRLKICSFMERGNHGDLN